MNRLSAHLKGLQGTSVKCSLSWCKVVMDIWLWWRKRYPSSFYSLTLLSLLSCMYTHWHTCVGFKFFMAVVLMIHFIPYFPWCNDIIGLWWCFRTMNELPGVSWIFPHLHICCSEVFFFGCWLSYVWIPFRKEMQAMMITMRMDLVTLILKGE